MNTQISRYVEQQIDRYVGMIILENTVTEQRSIWRNRNKVSVRVGMSKMKD